MRDSTSPKATSPGASAAGEAAAYGPPDAALPGQVWVSASTPAGGAGPDPLT
jgi:hypothetical protein